MFFKDVVEALESAGLIDFEGIAIFFEVATGDARGLIQRGDIGRSAIVDAGFGASQDIKLIDIDSGTFGDLDAVDGFTASIESCRPRAFGGNGNELGFLDRDEAWCGAVRPRGKTS